MQKIQGELVSMQTGIAYARYSSDNQREESIDAQLRAINEYAKKNDIAIIKTYIDEAESARTDDRPNFLKMMADIKNGLVKPDCLLLHKVDRFARDRIDAAYHKYTLKKLRIKILYADPSQQFGDNPEGRLLEGIMESFSQYQSENLASEVMKGMKENAYKAKHTGGIPPLGYSLNSEKELIINEAEAVIVRKIFDLYKQGYGYKSIANELNSKGYRTKTGKTFSQNSIYEILCNEKYSGTYVFNKRSSKDPLGVRNNRRFKDESEIIKIPGAIPAIIDQELFNKIQEKLKGRKRGPLMSGKRFYLLSGLITCGECGSTYTGNSYYHGRGGKKYYMYSCNNRSKGSGCKNKNIRQDVIEPFVIDELMKNVFSDEAIKKIVPQLLEYAKTFGEESSKDLKTIQTKIKDIESKIDRLLDAIADGVADKFLTKQKMDKLKSEYDELKEIEQFYKVRTFDWATEDNIKNFLLHNKEMLLNVENEKKRAAVELFIHKIVIYHDRIDIDFKVDVDRDNTGGGEGSRTPVRNQIHMCFSGCSRYFYIPLL